MSSSASVGVHLDKASAVVSGSAIRGSAGNSVGYGDGVIVAGTTGKLTLRQSVVEGNRRAGVLFDQGGGAITGSVVRGNKLAVCLEKGARPTIADDNLLEGNEANGVHTGRNLKPAPVPELPLAFW